MVRSGLTLAGEGWAVVARERRDEDVVSWAVRDREPSARVDGSLTNALSGLSGEFKSRWIGASAESGRWGAWWE